MINHSNQIIVCRERHTGDARQREHVLLNNYNNIIVQYYRSSCVNYCGYYIRLIA